MSRWSIAPNAYLLLYAVSLIFRIGTALPVQRAGYMDASYTQHVGEGLMRGRGLNEEVLWNYLDRPTGLPHPSNLYWPPLAALLAAPGMLVFGPGYRGAQICFVLLSAAVPLLAYWLALRLFGREDYAWTAGLLAAFSGFYTVYWVSPDNFTPFALTAALALFWLAEGLAAKPRYFFFSGLMMGVSNLARADGLLLLAVLPVWLVVRDLARLRTKRGNGGGVRSFSARRAIFLTVFGYLVVMVPWFARNEAAAGSVLASGSLQIIYLRSYDEFFRYQVRDLTLSRYLEWGWPAILASKANALFVNLAVVVLGALELFLSPFVLIGAWQSRGARETQLFTLYCGLVYFGLSLAFTFPSVRGSMLHSASVLVPFFAALAPAGLDRAVAWLAQRRKAWELGPAQRFFRAGTVMLAAVISLYLYAGGIFGGTGGSAAASTPLWNDRDREFAALGTWLGQAGVPLQEPVLVIDPPSFANDTGRRAIMIPTESVEGVWAAARQYGAHYLVLQFDHPQPLADLYSEKISVPGMVLAARFRDGLDRPTFLYRLEP